MNFLQLLSSKQLILLFCICLDSSGDPQAEKYIKESKCSVSMIQFFVLRITCFSLRCCSLLFVFCSDLLSLYEVFALVQNMFISTQWRMSSLPEMRCCDAVQQKNSMHLLTASRETVLLITLQCFFGLVDDAKGNTSYDYKCFAI